MGRGVFVVLGVLLVASALFAADHPALKSYEKFTAIPGAHAVGSDTCAGCHVDVAKGFQHAYHAAQGVQCEQCHGAGSQHVDNGGDKTKIIRFSARTPEEANGVCLSCHAQHDKVRAWPAAAHAEHHVRCIDCHDIHATEKPQDKLIPAFFDVQTRSPLNNTAEGFVPEARVKVRPRSETVEACLHCHQTQRGEMNMPYHHPLREAKLTCVDCHDPHGGPGAKNLRTANVNDLCLSCHAQYRGPFSYQHPPVTENCMNCHTPHGSANTNLLKLSMPALCLQCHAGHHNGANLPLADRCTDCHGSIHGTDVPTATGGSRFVDKGPWGVPNEPAHGMAAHGTGGGMSPLASHSSGRLGVGAGAAMSAFGAPLSGGNSMLPQAGGSSSAESMGGADTAFSITPGSYRFLDGSGFLGRVGEYDSLEQSAGAEMQSAYVSPGHELLLVTRGDVTTSDDYRFASQFSALERIKAELDVRSFVQQQDTYPFYSNIISPDIVVTNSTISGATYGITRRLGKGSASVDLPKIPVRLFVKGDWQARSGTQDFPYLDEGGDSGCNFCHFRNQYQAVNQTTRTVAGGADVALGTVKLTYQHQYSSFHDRLLFPAGNYGATLMELEPGPLPVNDTPPGKYFLDIPAPNTASSDTLNASWVPISAFMFNAHFTYSRLRDEFTGHPQNDFNTDETASWHTLPRLRLTADYHQYNMLNDFTPFYSYYGNVSYHDYNLGVKADYELTSMVDVDAYYRHGSITRSNAYLWPQAYSPDNTDLLRVVPSSTSETGGLALRLHGNSWTTRAGYEYTSTDNPGYLTTPGSNNRAFAGVTLTPYPWLMFSNDTDVIVQNAFYGGLRRNRLYSNTLSATMRPVAGWDLQLGHSYQQNNLNSYMAFQNDNSVGYVLDEPFVPFKQISQTYWGQSSYTFGKKLGVVARVSYNSARSGYRPDVNPNDGALLGNAGLIAQGAFDPVLFQQAQAAALLGATQVSEVIVPQWVGQSKVYYVFPRKFNGGVIIYYGSYRDVWNPNLNGVLRSFSLFAGKTW